MANMWSFCFIISFHNFATLGNRLTYHCPSSWPVVITMKKKLATTWKKKKKKGILAGPNEWQQFASGEILKKPVEIVKGRILAGWAQKSPEPRLEISNHSMKSFIFSTISTSSEWYPHRHVRLSLVTFGIEASNSVVEPRMSMAPWLSQWSLTNANVHYFFMSVYAWTLQLKAHGKFNLTNP